MDSSSRIRNFAIIAHIDAGKSTLSDRLMELTNTISFNDNNQQILDSNPIERERGVTIKLAPVTMNYQLNRVNYILNLIDTPGHMDFSYEVDRSLAACEGAVLLIDGLKGIQAQTLSHAQTALKLGLKLIPVINKIDLPSTDLSKSLVQLNEVFGFSKNEVSQISAKTGQGVSHLLDLIISQVPLPSGQSHGPARCLIFNSIYHEHLGVIAFVRVVDGSISPTDQLQTLRQEQKFTPKEIGLFSPQRVPIDLLTAGQVGYIATGFKDIHQIQVGDTITSQKSPSRTGQAPVKSQKLVPLPGYRPPQPVVFADVYPSQSTTFLRLTEAVDKLQLSDASLSSSPVHSTALGPGIRLGFLGLFHIEITKERLNREQNVHIVLTSPTVRYLVTDNKGRIQSIQNPNSLPDSSNIRSISEPITIATLITPTEYLGSLMQLLQEHRAVYIDTRYLGNQAKLIYQLPLVELISGLIDKIKSASQGYATLDYQHSGRQIVSAVKLDILVNHQPVEALTRIVVKQQAGRVGRQIVSDLKKLLPSQQFAVPIQAVVNGRIIARETKKALRKDVTAKLYGGDQTRKDKLLKKQKKGKKRLSKFGQIQVPEAVLTKIATS